MPINAPQMYGVPAPAGWPAEFSSMQFRSSTPPASTSLYGLGWDQSQNRLNQAFVDTNEAERLRVQNIMNGPANAAMAQYGANPSPAAVNPITARMQQLYSGFNTPVGGGGYRPPGNPYVPSMAPNGAGRPVGSMVASPRSEPVSQAVTQAYGTRTGNQTAANQSLGDWTREFLANRPRAQQFASEETNAIGRMYGSGSDSAQGELARIRQQRATAIRDMTEAAYRRAGRSNNLRRMGSGNSSYMDRLYAQDMGNIGSQAAVQGFDQQRDDALYLNQQRSNLAGTRQGLMDQLLQREMMPVQARSMVEGDNLSRVGQIANLDYGNNQYQNAEDAYRRRAEYLQELMSMGVQV